MPHAPVQLAALTLALATGCFRGPSSAAPPTPVVSARAGAPVPSVAIVSDAEWRACQASETPAIGIGIGVDGGDAQFYCEDQMLEGGAPLRYEHLPVIAADGSVLAVVEERDGWGHVRPGVRLIDLAGTSVAWFPLADNGDLAAAVAKANAALRARAWVPVVRPEVTHATIDDDHSETTLSIGPYTAVYQRTNDGNYWLPPSRITVRDARGTELVTRTDTERAWHAPPRCNLPHFELVGASAAPGAILFKTGLGMGGHNCDGVAQPPAWHVLAFPAR